MGLTMLLANKPKKFIVAKASADKVFMNKFKLKKQVLIIRAAYFLLLILALAGSSCKSSKKNKDQKSNHPTTTTKGKKEKKEKNSSSEIRGQAGKVIKTARSYIGTSYRYGGTTREGLDCSGLMLLSYQSVEIKLPRNSEAQSKIGHPVSESDLKPGDLLFFSDRKGHKKVTHVGMVTEVKDHQNIKFIHSTTKLGVVENNLKSEIYYPIFLKAVRVL